LPEPAAFSLVTAYLSDLWAVLSGPKKFFGALPIQGGMSRPLAFALVTHWVGAATEFLWRALFGGATDWINRTFQWLQESASLDVDSPGRGRDLLVIRDRLGEWFSGVGPILADPFFTLGSILLTAMFVFLGAKLLVPVDRDKHPVVTYESAVRIVAYGLSPSILAVIPFFGGVLSYCMVIFVTVVGAMQIYRVGVFRGIVVGLFPKVLFVGTMLLGVFALVALIFRIFFG